MLVVFFKTCTDVTYTDSTLYMWGGVKPSVYSYISNLHLYTCFGSVSGFYINVGEKDSPE